MDTDAPLLHLIEERTRQHPQGLERSSLKVQCAFFDANPELITPRYLINFSANLPGGHRRVRGRANQEVSRALDSAAAQFFDISSLPALVHTYETGLDYPSGPLLRMMGNLLNLYEQVRRETRYSHYDLVA